MEVVPVGYLQVGKNFGEVDEPHFAADFGEPFGFQSEAEEQIGILLAHIYEVDFFGPTFAFEAARRSGEGTRR